MFLARAGDPSSAARAVLFTSDERPQHTSIVDGERNSGHVGTVLELKLVYRNASAIPATLNHPNRGTSSVNKEGAQIAVSPVADA
jgi:hypothetical protein